MRLEHAKNRPWKVESGFIAKGSTKARKRAAKMETREGHSFLALLYKTEHMPDESLQFVAHSPDDIEDLLREVGVLRIMASKLKEERDSALNDIASVRIARDRAEEKISDMRRAWRSLCDEMGRKPS